MYSLEEIKKFILDNFDDEWTFKDYGIQPTETFIHDTAHEIKGLLDEGECKTIEEAWYFIIVLTDGKYWEHIAEEQRKEINSILDFDDVDIFMEVDELFEKGLL